MRNAEHRGVALRFLAMTSRRAALRPGASMEAHDANSPSIAARRSSRGHCGGNASREGSYFIVGGIILLGCMYQRCLRLGASLVSRADFPEPENCRSNLFEAAALAASPPMP